MGSVPVHVPVERESSCPSRATPLIAGGSVLAGAAARALAGAPRSTDKRAATRRTGERGTARYSAVALGSGPAQPVRDYLKRYVMRPRVRSYGETSTRTRSPGRTRMR